MKGRILVAAFIWLVIIGLGAACWKYFIAPQRKQAVKDAEQQALVKQQNEVLRNTSGSTRYDNQIDFAIDSFAGFAILRSEKFQAELAKHRIKVNLIDDGANYDERIKAFEQGKVQMGVFTVDALIKASSGKAAPPATIIALVDETRGADAMVAYSEAFPNVDALNAPDVEYVMAPGPSETLTRVLMSHFHITNVAKNFKFVDDGRAVFEMYRKAKPTDRRVYVTWEPFISKMTDNPNTHVLVDSGRFRGYIMDVIVVNRDYLFKNRQVVENFLSAYFRTLYEYRDGMVELVLDDCRKTGTVLSDKEAKRLVDGIWWKNTSDNMAQMGVLDKQSLQHVEDVIGNITHVLVSTQAIPNDPTKGRYNLLYYDGVLKEMQSKGFHPGVEKLRDDRVVLPTLTDKQWSQLVPVGQLDVPPLVFGRGTSSLSDTSTATLDELVEKLKTWPQYYLLVKGTATSRGDAEANKALAKDRAQAAADYLIQHGIEPQRVRATSELTAESSVLFMLGQAPY